MGILLATKDFELKQAYRLIGAGMVLVVGGVILMSHNYVYISVLHSGYGLFYAGVITLAFKLDGFKKFLSTPIMIWLGERSYSLFLIHFSVFYLVDSTVARFTTDRTAMYGLLTRAIGVPLALFFAMLLFYFVERRQARGLMTDKAFWPWQVKKLKM
jgi:peptidoglycan/LPS O-acetylase OafA/YrhL